VSERPGNGRPIQFIHYACGHSTPVRGTGATVNRKCEHCLAHHYTGRRQLGLGEITLQRLLGVRPDSTPTIHPGPYCDCDMCQSRIP